MIKKINVFFISMLIITTGTILFTTVSNAEENCLINLPDYEILMTQTFLNNPFSFFNIYFEGIGEGYDVEDSPTNYLGWCVDVGSPIPMSNNPYSVKLYSSYCPPEKFKYHMYNEGKRLDIPIPVNWAAINWIINHKQGIWEDVSNAVRYFANFGPTISPIGGSYYEAMIADALKNSEGYIPGCGEKIVVIIDTNPENSEPAYLYHRYQYPIIEVPIPCKGEGLTPGFWKNKGVKVGWPSPYTTGMTLEQAGFIIPGGSMTDNQKRPVYFDDTLIEALNYKGGEELSGMAQILLRAAVAAILNSAHPEVNYPLTVGEIIDNVNDALIKDRDTMELLKDELDTYNNLKADEWW